MKNIVMNATIDPKDPRSKIGGLNNLQPNNQHLLEQLMDENEPWLLRTIPHRGPFLVDTIYLERDSPSSDQHIKKLLSLREGLYVMMQCYLRQHNAERDWLHEHPGRFAA